MRNHVKQNDAVGLTFHYCKIKVEREYLFLVVVDGIKIKYLYNTELISFYSCPFLKISYFVVCSRLL